MPPRKVNLFDESSPFLNKFMFISLGILAGLLFIGTLWSILFRIGGRVKQPNALGKHLTYIVTCNSNSGTMTSLLSLPTCVAEGQVFKKRLVISNLTR